MSYLEELLPEFRKGAKIRCKYWASHIFIQNIDDDDIDIKDLHRDDWEFYREPIDWDYIIKNKCLCWFWNGDDRNKGVIDYLVTVSNESYELYENTSGCRWSHCRPVRRDEVTFYEDIEKND